jgi:hypothetical protein
MSSPVSLTNAKLAALADGLLSLDGLRTSQTEFRPYRFDDAGDMAWAIAGNVVVAQDSLRAFERAKKALAAQFDIRENEPMANTPENKERAEKFLAALDDLAEKPVSIPGLTPISRKSLNVGPGPKQNPVPPSVLAKLTPLLTD